MLFQRGLATRWLNHRHCSMVGQAHLCRLRADRGCALPTPHELGHFFSQKRVAAGRLQTFSCALHAYSATFEHRSAGRSSVTALVSFPGRGKGTPSSRFPSRGPGTAGADFRRHPALAPPRLRQPRSASPTRTATIVPSISSTSSHACSLLIPSGSRSILPEGASPPLAHRPLPRRDAREVGVVTEGA